MTYPWLSFRRGLVTLSIALVTAACSAPTPVIRQPYSAGGGSGDGGLPGTAGTGGLPGAELPGSNGGNTGAGAGGATGAGGGAAGSGGAMAIDGGVGGAGAGGSPGRGGASGAGGVMAMGGRSGSGGAGGNTGMPDAGRMDMGPSMGSGGMMTSPPDAPLEASSLDVPPPPPDVSTPNGAACMKSGWMVEASRLCTAGQCLAMMASRKEPRYAVDGDLDTRYTSGLPQGSMGAETVTVTFPGPITITGVTITSQVGDGAAAYRIESSTDGRNFSAFAPPVEGTGSDNIVVTFAAKTMRALRITQTGMKSVPWWSIHEISVAGCTTP